MDIPSYATCSMCAEWEDDKCLSNFGTCPVANDAAIEGLIQAGYPRPSSVNVKLAWNAKPCPEWTASAEGQRELDIIKRDQDQNQGLVTPPSDPAHWAQTGGRGW